MTKLTINGAHSHHLRSFSIIIGSFSPYKRRLEQLGRQYNYFFISKIECQRPFDRWNKQIGKLKLLGNIEFYRQCWNNNVNVHCILCLFWMLVHKRCNLVSRNYTNFYAVFLTLFHHSTRNFANSEEKSFFKNYSLILVKSFSYI